MHNFNSVWSQTKRKSFLDWQGKSFYMLNFFYNAALEITENKTNILNLLNSIFTLKFCSIKYLL